MSRISSRPVRVVLLIAAIIVVVAVGIFYLAASSSSLARKAEAEKVATKRYVAAHPPAPASASQPQPTTKLLTFKESPIVSFEYNGGPLIWEAQGGEVEFVDPLGNKWKDDPSKVEAGIKNNQLHKGWHFVSKTKDSKATGVKITQFW